MPGRFAGMLVIALPPRRNVSVDVAGVVHVASGTRTVTNTHGCVLN